MLSIIDILLAAESVDMKDTSSLSGNHSSSGQRNDATELYAEHRTRDSEHQVICSWCSMEKAAHCCISIRGKQHMDAPGGGGCIPEIAARHQLHVSNDAARHQLQEGTPATNC